MPAMAKEKRLAAGAKGEGGLNSATMPAIPANCRPSRRRTLRHNISASTSAAGALESAWRALSSGHMPRAAGVHQRAREDERRRLIEPALHLFEPALLALQTSPRRPFVFLFVIYVYTVINQKYFPSQHGGSSARAGPAGTWTESV